MLTLIAVILVAAAFSTACFGRPSRPEPAPIPTPPPVQPEAVEPTSTPTAVPTPPPMPTSTPTVTPTAAAPVRANTTTPAPVPPTATPSPTLVPPTATPSPTPGTVEDVETLRKMFEEYWEAFNSYDADTVVSMYNEDYRAAREETVRSDISLMKMFKCHSESEGGESSGAHRAKCGRDVR